MDPCPFAKLIIESLSLKLPNNAAKQPSGGPGIHPSATPCFCKLRLTGFPTQTALLPLSSDAPPDSSSPAAVFHLDATALRRAPAAALRVSVYAGRTGRGCGVGSGGKQLLGRVEVAVALAGTEARAAVFHGGWVKLVGGGGGGGDELRLHMVVRSEPDPRFVFQFGGEPECSPVVFQIQGNIQQPVFSCKFSADRNSRSRSLPSDFNGMSSTPTTNGKGWMRRTFSGEREGAGHRRERKGWMVTIHDLSGSPVAAASMTTPFVPSPGSDRVSRSNPGAWLILRPDHPPSAATWKPWGRLEAWRDRPDALGYRFELAAAAGTPIAEATVSVKKGGRFCIDSHQGSGLNNNIISPVMFRGFVMGSTVEGEGKVSKPAVQVGACHVTCMADAALFVALSAAVDLSMDACRLFSDKLRKELCHHEHHDFFAA